MDDGRRTIGDGNRVLRVTAEETTLSIGDLYEVFSPAGGSGFGEGVGRFSLPPTPPPETVSLGGQRAIVPPQQL